MVVQLRLDERLIHGQITTAWSKALQITTILCANDQAAHDPVSRKALLMARPAGIKVAVRGMQESIGLLKDPRAERMQILMLVGNPKDALDAVRELHIREVNVANYMRKAGSNKKKITEYCEADGEDLAYFSQLADVCRVYSQMVPNSEVYELNSKIKSLTEDGKDD